MNRLVEIIGKECSKNSNYSKLNREKEQIRNRKRQQQRYFSEICQNKITSDFFLVKTNGQPNSNKTKPRKQNITKHNKTRNEKEYITSRKNSSFTFICFLTSNGISFVVQIDLAGGWIQKIISWRVELLDISYPLNARPWTDRKAYH